MSTENTETKPIRLYFKSYIQLIRNSIGSNLFRNFYVMDESQGEFDALDDGYNSCAFFVSAVLVILKKNGSIHGTVESTINDLKKSGWNEVNSPKSGDVLVWEAVEFNEGSKKHIGFSIGKGRAISISINTKAPIEHDQNFGDQKRRIIQIFRMNKW